MQRKLFDDPVCSIPPRNGETREPYGRIDADPETHAKLLAYCRLRPGEVWLDSEKGHRVGVLDATNVEHVAGVVGEDRPALFVNDPPYNVAVGNSNTCNLPKTELSAYMVFSRKWVENCARVMGDNAHFYVWLGADVRDNFQPLPDFMIMMRDIPQLKPRNFITLRNQRGYGTQKNWMWVRQELLHYIHGDPDFTVQYTNIPKILRGYYKNVNGKITENIERSKSGNIRPGNVWVDVQQVFYRMEENVPGCYAQKPLKAIERILLSSSKAGDCVLDCFSHSGTTLIAGEKLGRRVVTCDIDPVFAELTIRRLEHYRKTGRTGWQWHNPFPEMEQVYDAAATA
ncbi:MAG TPA: site-specific DNA-methyltransferase [bacterium]|nr:site-specific DNA-methyltransferase [bacterium]HQL62920.1 site-specific DNA-methyltransferase [bacterium]